MYMHVCVCVSLRSDGKPWGCTWGDYDYVYAILCRCRCYVRLVSAHIMFFFRLGSFKRQCFEISPDRYAQCVPLKHQ